MTNIPLEIPPGFALSSSPNGVKGRFTGGDKVRFKAKFPEKWAGWVQYIANTLLGVARGMVSWTDTFGNINVAIGTNLKLYAIVGDSSFDDITPIRATATLVADPFTVANGSAVVTVTHSSHLASESDFVTYSGADLVGGLNLNAEWQIVSIIDNNTYTITASQNAVLTANRKVLLHFDGTNTSTSIRDNNEAGSSHAWTAHGSAQIDTSTSQFGGASLKLNGSTDYVDTSDSADFTLSGDFTLECWFKANDAGGALVSLGGQVSSSGIANANTAWALQKNASNVLLFSIVSGTTVTTITGTTTFTNALHTGWHMVEVVRGGNTLKMFVDGVQEGGNVAFSSTVNDSSAALVIGRPGAQNANYWNGWIDEFRFVNGAALHTANFTPPTAAFSDGSPGGGQAVVAAYQINTGSDGTVYGLGYGAGSYNVGTYGTARAQGIATEGRVWSNIGYGNDLLSSPLGGGLYFWDNITPRSVVVANAPTSMRAMFVTPERFVFALGTTTKMTVAWPDVNDFTDWTPSPTNTANVRKLQSGNQLMNGAPLTDGISLVWSDTSLYLFQKITTDEIYSSRLIGDNIGLIGPLAFVMVAGVAFWMAPQGFYMFTGSIQQIPNWQDVQTFVYADMDLSQVAKVWGFYDQPNNQVRFHYCSNGALTPDKYVDVELTDWAWTTGTFDGTTGCRHRPQEASSLFVDSTSTIFSFNVGLDAAGVAIHASLQYGLYSLNRGENNSDIFNLWPDVQRQVGNLTYTCETKDYSDDAATLDSLVLTVAPNAGKVEARSCGRYWTMKVESNQLGGDFRLGIPKVEIDDSGMRE